MVATVNVAVAEPTPNVTVLAPKSPAGTKSSPPATSTLTVNAAAVDPLRASANNASEPSFNVSSGPVIVTSAAAPASSSVMVMVCRATASPRKSNATSMLSPESSTVSSTAVTVVVTDRVPPGRVMV